MPDVQKSILQIQSTSRGKHLGSIHFPLKEKFAFLSLVAWLKGLAKDQVGRHVPFNTGTRAFSTMTRWGGGRVLDD